MRHKTITLLTLLIFGLLIATALPALANQAAAQPGAIAISSGCYGTYTALLDNGTVWVWGDNQYGQAGDGTIRLPRLGQVTAPVMSGIDNVIEAVTSGGHTIVLKADGTVWEWGFISSSRDGESVLKPRQVPGLKDIRHVSAGTAHALAVDGNGSVWAWGNNYFGAFGNGESGNYAYPPVRIPIADVRQIACGAGYTVVLKDDGTVWTAGYGDNGTGCCEGSEHPPFQPEFTRVPIAGVTAVSCSNSGYTLALKEDGTVWGWGENDAFQLGNYTLTNEQMTPVWVGGLTDVIAISAGSSCGLALKNDGTVWAWGSNDRGSLGNGVYSFFKTTDPLEVAGLDHITAISAFATPGIALKDDGTVWTWGLPQSSEAVPRDGSGTMLRQIIIGSPVADLPPVPVTTPLPSQAQPAADGSDAVFGNATVTSQSLAPAINETIRHLILDDTGGLYALGDRSVYRLKADGDLLWSVDIPPQWKINENFWRPSFNYESTAILQHVMSRAIYDTADGYLYLYLTPSQPYPCLDNWYDKTIATDGLVWALMAIAPDGRIAWTLPLATDREYLDSTTVRAIGDLIYLFHDYNETVIDKDGRVLFTVSDISDPASIDEAGNLYVTRTIKKYMEAAGNDYSDYRLPSSIVEAYGPDGAMLWHKDMGENLRRQYIAEEIRAKSSALPLYQDGTLYVPVKDGIIALDTDGNEIWSKRFGDGYYGLFFLMPLDSDGNVYMGYFGVSGQAANPEKLYVISDEGRTTIGPRDYTYRYDGMNHPAALNGVIYDTEIKGFDDELPLENLPYVIVRAYDIRNATYLWSYRVEPGVKTTTVVDEANASYICGFIDHTFSDPGENADYALGRNKFECISGTGVRTWEFVDVTPGTEAVYVALRALKYDYPVTIGKSRAVYASGVYAFSPDGQPLVRTESGTLATAIAVNNSTVIFGGANGGISMGTAAVGVVAGIALLGAIAIFAKFFMFGTVARARSRIDKNENRNLVLAYVREHPGLTLYELSRGMKMNMGTVRY
ncbi:MAG: hypothetical protein WBZ29_09435, partial [Methanocella sp.]